MAQKRKKRGQGILFLFNFTLILSLIACTPVRPIFKKARFLDGMASTGLLPIVVPREEKRHFANYRVGMISGARDRAFEKSGLLSRQKRDHLRSWDQFQGSEYKSYRYGYPKGTNIFNIVPGLPGNVFGKNVWQYWAELAAHLAREGHGLSRFWNDMLHTRGEHHRYHLNLAVLSLENMVTKIALYFFFHIQT